MDFLIFQFINKLAGRYSLLDNLAVFFAEYLGYILILILFLFLLKDSKKYRPMIVKGFLAAIIARFGVVELIRFFWERQRPFVENNVNLLLSHEGTGSFPSGHAAFFFALATVIFLYEKKVYPVPNRRFWCGAGILFFLASFLISISRVFAGVHWPSDILAGAIVGIFSGWLINKISKKFSNFQKEKHL